MLFLLINRKWRINYSLVNGCNFSTLKIYILQIQSLDTGELPRDWSLANVAPIFKKGNRVLAENYRPVSLTCITCKLFEHIVCRHILDHVEDHKILTNLQHGFRSGRNCETQLTTTTHDLLSSFNSKSQIDVAILDFSKAFDTVPHAGLLGKLEHYDIHSKILLWITNFLNNRKQRVVADGIFFQSYHIERHLFAYTFQHSNCEFNCVYLQVHLRYWINFFLIMPTLNPAFHKEQFQVLSYFYFTLTTYHLV